MSAASALLVRLPGLFKIRRKPEILPLDLSRIIQKSPAISQDTEKHRESLDEFWRTAEWLLKFTVESN